MKKLSPLDPAHDDRNFSRSKRAPSATSKIVSSCCSCSCLLGCIINTLLERRRRRNLSEKKARFHRWNSFSFKGKKKVLRNRLRT